MEAILILLGLLAFVGIGAAVWVAWGEPVGAELRRGGALIALSVAVLVLALVLVLGLRPPERSGAPGDGSAVLDDAGEGERAAYRIPGDGPAGIRSASAEPLIR